ncbi:NAD(P)/FAD-dependent oxidoreductase [Bradyrhizobium sp. 1.29L]
MTNSPTNPSPQTVAVIGAGIVGAASACSLARDGHRVTIFDPNKPEVAASFGNAGLITPGGCVPNAMPGIWRKVPKMLLDSNSPLTIRPSYALRIAPFLLRMLASSRPARVEEISKGLAGLLEGAEEAYFDLLGETAGELIRRTGLLYTFRSEDSFAGAAGSIDLRTRRGVKLEILGPEELYRLAPSLDRKHVKGIYLPDAAHSLDPQSLVSALLDKAANHGALFEYQRVDRIEVLGDARLKLWSGREQRVFDKIVIAAGAWSRELARQVGARVPLEAERGYHVMLEKPGLEIRVPMISDFGIAVTPMRHGLRITGIVEFADVSARPDWSKVARILSQAKRLLPDLQTDSHTRWMGPRPALPDTLPVISPAPATPNAILAFGHGHLGVTFGGVTGQLVANLIAGRPNRQLSAYRSSRFVFM